MIAPTPEYPTSYPTFREWWVNRALKKIWRDKEEACREAWEMGVKAGRREGEK